MNRLEQLRSIVTTEILNNNTDIEDAIYGLVHLSGVSQYCCLLAAKRGIDTEIAACCGLLHDIYTYKIEYTKNHAELGVPEAKRILDQINAFSADETTLILAAIEQHSDKETIDTENPYAEVLKDADTLQNSLYNPRIRVKHKQRLKLILKELSIGIKIKELRRNITETSEENSDS